MNGMDISKFQELNAARAKRWHNQDPKQWTILEWAGAMAGETGEACNAAKKLRRLAFSLPNKVAGLDMNDRHELEFRLAQEVADSINYGLIILSELNIDASAILATTFNKKSKEYGFPEMVNPLTFEQFERKTLPK